MTSKAVRPRTAIWHMDLERIECFINDQSCFWMFDLYGTFSRPVGAIVVTRRRAVFDEAARPKEGAEKSKMAFETADARAAASAENLESRPRRISQTGSPQL